jgi:acyl carrier protein
VHVDIPSETTDLFETGAVDSLSLVEILVRLEEELGAQIRLDELELDDLRSVAAIARLLARNGHPS